MRLLSVRYTERSCVLGSKTETRRLGWLFARVGDRLLLVRKNQGRKPGEPIVPIAHVEIVGLWREPLNAITRAGVRREGLRATPREFVRHFSKTMRIPPEKDVTVIRWRYLQWIHDPPLVKGDYVRANPIHGKDRVWHFGDVEDVFDLGWLQGPAVRIRPDRAGMKSFVTVASLCCRASKFGIIEAGRRPLQIENLFELDLIDERNKEIERRNRERRAADVRGAKPSQSDDKNGDGTTGLDLPSRPGRGVDPVEGSPRKRKRPRRTRSRSRTDKNKPDKYAGIDRPF